MYIHLNINIVYKHVPKKVLHKKAQFWCCFVQSLPYYHNYGRRHLVWNRLLCIMSVYLCLYVYAISVSRTVLTLNFISFKKAFCINYFSLGGIQLRESVAVETFIRVSIVRWSGKKRFIIISPILIFR